MSATYASFTNRKRTNAWGIAETKGFYKALRKTGIDFVTMER
jgi:hypothetical protein